MRRLNLRRSGLLIAGLILCASACAGAVSGCLDFHNTTSERTTRLATRPVALGPFGARLAPGVRYAGGLTLRGQAFHGLSDLKQVPGAASSVAAVSDFGHLVRFRLMLDAQGDLVGAGEATLSPLVNETLQPLTPKRLADAEGLAFLADGRLLVSFEGDHRIRAYDANRPAARAPVAVAHPDHPFSANAGMEVLASAPGGGWLVMGEEGGAWLCSDDQPCARLPHAPQAPQDGFRFTGADIDPAGNGWFVVERRWRPPLSFSARVRFMDRQGRMGPVLLSLAPPSAADNMEGIAAAATDRGVRLYLLSDDNGLALQRTLLLAFDVSAEADVTPVR